jgi:hypothetical protein
MNAPLWQPPPPGDPEVIEAQALRRRQVIGAFLLGTDDRGDHGTRTTLRGLLLGTALAAVVALVLVIAGLLSHARHP